MTYTSPLLSQPGSVPPPDDSHDAGVPWHFGDPFAEQRAAARGAVVVDRSNRGLLAIPGADRLSWLHSLTSQHFTSLADGMGTEALVLDMHGHVEHHTVVAHLDGSVWLDTEPGSAAALLSYLDSMRFWSKVEPRDASAELAVLSLLGPATGDVLAAMEVTLPASPYGVNVLDGPGAAGGGIVRRMPWPALQSADLLVPRQELETWWGRLRDAGARPAGSMAFEALRVEALRPRLGIDTDDRTIPHEVGWIGVAVHLEKGCYRGQETVSKVHNVGRPPRVMVLLHLDGSPDVLPETGDAVRSGDRVIGRVGTAVSHHDLGPIALALLKRSAAREGSVAGDLVAGDEDRAVAAAIDPDSIPPEKPAPGRDAARALGR